LTIALLLGSALYVAHVGDTRCYLLQAGVLSRLTTDHNLAQKFAEMSPAGSDPPAHLQNILWNALGGSSDVPRPELAKVSLTPGATLLLCSDGLNKHVTDEQIQSVLESPTSCAARCARLVELANAGGGSDNITAVIATVGASNTFPPPPSR
jgi:protein phosphatase